MTPLLVEFDGADTLSSLLVDTGWCAVLCIEEMSMAEGDLYMRFLCKAECFHCTKITDC